MKHRNNKKEWSDDETKTSIKEIKMIREFHRPKI